jgi:hypothetical protein
LDSSLEFGHAVFVSFFQDEAPASVSFGGLHAGDRSAGEMLNVQVSVKSDDAGSSAWK